MELKKILLERIEKEVTCEDELSEKSEQFFLYGVVNSVYVVTERDNYGF